GNVADYIVDAELVMADGRRTTLGELAPTPAEKLPAPFRRLHRLYTDHGAVIETAYPDTAYNSAGYNLRGLVQGGRLALGHLLGGSEGTLALVTRLTFRLIAKPACDSLVVAYMDDIQASALAVQKILPLGPAGIEIMDKSLLALARREDPALAKSLPEDVDNVLLIEFDGPDEATCQKANAQVLEALKGLTDRVHPATAKAEKERFWAVRKAAVPILYRLKGRRQILALIEDAAVPVRHLGTYFKEVYALLERHKVPFVVYGHIAKGLMHTRPLLEIYREQGTLGAKLARREILAYPPVRFTALEQQVYDELEDYCTELTTQITRHATGGSIRTSLGFYLSFLRLRFASSLFAIKETLRRRLDRVTRTLNFQMDLSQ
ncbi:MAG: hypothetical protein EOM10_16670, partial [Opitutae bacterium]|nr:hypothetical protein [Opitutae bacterium]